MDRLSDMRCRITVVGDSMIGTMDGGSRVRISIHLIVVRIVMFLTPFHLSIGLGLVAMMQRLSIDAIL